MLDAHLVSLLCCFQTILDMENTRNYGLIKAITTQNVVNFKIGRTKDENNKTSSEIEMEFHQGCTVHHNHKTFLFITHLDSR